MVCNGEKKTCLIDDVKEHYGKILKATADISTTACQVPVGGLSRHVRDALASVHPDVLSKFYGCGTVVPECLTGATVVDLGSGSGRDCYALAKLVGESGQVIGVDMTDEQLEISNQYIEHHRQAFGYEKSNVSFLKGYIEHLHDVGIADHSVDIVVSNCVINMCMDKRAVLKEAYRVLKYGGEMYYSDMYCDRVLPDEVRHHKLVWGEGGGALYWKLLFEICEELGFEKPREVSARTIHITKPQLKQLVGDARFISATYRLFKLDPRLPAGNRVTYNGGITGCEKCFKLDHKHAFGVGQGVVVDTRTAAVLHQTRMCEYFTFAQDDTFVPEPEGENPFKQTDTAPCGQGGHCHLTEAGDT